MSGTPWLPLCPRPPRWEVDWPAIDGAFPWVRALRGCPQDPVHHAEGDVWLHTRQVCEELAALPGFQSLHEDERVVLFAAALLHDVAKPACTRTEEEGRVAARGHARRGAIQARALLWRMGVPMSAREQVEALVRYHQTPFYLIERADSQRLAIAISQAARCDLLALLAEADARGRTCHDQARLLDMTTLFAEYCGEQGCLSAPYIFPSDHARFLYFRTPGRDPTYAAHDDTRCEALILSGLPGAGKDHWLREHRPDLPVLALDAVRAELGVDPTDPQGAVVDRARDLARDYLRQGRDFAWNATHLSRDMRERSISLCAAYNARVHLVYVEVDETRLWRQNAARRQPVPEAAIERLLARWEVPDRTEAHVVDWAMGS